MRPNPYILPKWTLSQWITVVSSATIHIHWALLKFGVLFLSKVSKLDKLCTGVSKFVHRGEGAFVRFVREDNRVSKIKTVPQ